MLNCWQGHGLLSLGILEVEDNPVGPHPCDSEKLATESLNYEMLYQINSSWVAVLVMSGQ